MASFQAGSFYPRGNDRTSFLALLNRLIHRFFQPFWLGPVRINPLHRWKEHLKKLLKTHERIALQSRVILQTRAFGVGQVRALSIQTSINVATYWRNTFASLGHMTFELNWSAYYLIIGN